MTLRSIVQLRVANALTTKPPSLSILLWSLSDFPQGLTGTAEERPPAAPNFLL
jgi:hypothetical protein